MAEQKFIQKAREAFDFNKDLQEVFITSDDNCFTRHNDAANHARSLENKEVVKITRQEALPAKKINPPAETGKTGKAAATAGSKPAGNKGGAGKSPAKGAGKAPDKKTGAAAAAATVNPGEEDDKGDTTAENGEKGDGNEG